MQDTVLDIPLEVQVQTRLKRGNEVKLASRLHRKAHAGPWPIWPQTHPLLTPCCAGICRWLLGLMSSGDRVWLKGDINCGARGRRRLPSWPQEGRTIQAWHSSATLTSLGTLTSGHRWSHLYPLSLQPGLGNGLWCHPLGCLAILSWTQGTTSLPNLLQFVFGAVSPFPVECWRMWSLCWLLVVIPSFSKWDEKKIWLNHQVYIFFSVSTSHLLVWNIWNSPFVVKRKVSNSICFSPGFSYPSCLLDLCPQILPA